MSQKRSVAAAKDLERWPERWENQTRWHDGRIPSLSTSFMFTCRSACSHRSCRLRAGSLPASVGCTSRRGRLRPATPRLPKLNILKGITGHCYYLQHINLWVLISSLASVRLCSTNTSCRCRLLPGRHLSILVLCDALGWPALPRPLTLDPRVSTRPYLPPPSQRQSQGEGSIDPGQMTAGGNWDAIDT